MCRRDVRGCTPEDIVGDALYLYLKNHELRDVWISARYPPDQKLLGLTQLLSIMCHGCIYDRLRRNKHTLNLEEPYPANPDLFRECSVDPTREYEQTDLIDALRRAASPEDRPILDAFIRISEGHLQNINQQAVTESGKSMKEVLSFKKRHRRG